MATKEYDRTVLHSRLADGYGRACVAAAEADAAKGKARERLASFANGEDVLFIGDAYDVTVTSASCAKLVVEDLLDDLARTYGIKPEVMENLKRRHTTTVTSTRVCAKARVEREAA